MSATMTKVLRDLDPRSMSPERAAFLVGFALLAVSPIPFASQAGLDILRGVEALTALPALAMAAIAVVTGARVAYALSGILAVLPASYVVVWSTGGRIITNPLAGAEFVSQALLLAGALIALPAGLAILLRQARTQAAPLALRLRAWPLALALVLAALATGASASATLAALHAPTDARSGGLGFAPDARLSLVMEGMAFLPAAKAVRVGEVTQIDVVNRDAVFHTFSYEVDGQRFDHAVRPGETVGVLLRLDEPGAMPFWCAPHASKRADGYVGMVGRLVVQE